MKRRSQQRLLSWFLFFCYRSVVVQGIRIAPSSLTSTTPARTVDYETLDSHHATRGHRRLSSKNVEVDVPTDPNDHLVESLPYLDDGAFPTKHWAGHLPASPDGDKYFFYWLFEPDLSRNKIPQDDIPLLIWLNGGPGCSSMDGLFLENGPLRLNVVDGEWKLQPHGESWHKAPAYVVYIDQPVGTGLSFTTSGKYPKNDKEVNQDFYYFLKEFLKLHSDKFLDDNKLKRKFFFSGESHAGHYIPSMMAYILKQNSNNPEIDIPLSGAAIGNGWVDPMYQYAAAGVAYGYGLIDLAQKAALDAQELECRSELQAGKYTSGKCYGLLDKVVIQSEGGSSKHKVSQYDARKRESKHHPRTFPPGHKDVESYLGSYATTPDRPMMDSDVTNNALKALHATASVDAGQRYMECTDPPFNALSHQDGLGVVPDVVYILEHSSNVELLFFNGVWDLICNHVGNEEVLQNLPWKHRDDWIKAKRYSWVAPNLEMEDDNASGYIKEYKNLKFLKVLDSGHMVPMDVPEVSFGMIQTFMYGGSFDSNEQKLDRSLENNNPSCPVCPTTANCDNVDTTTTTNASSAEGNDSTGMKFVVRHSWIGALLAVVAFLAVFLVFRRRSEYQGASQREFEYEMELKEQTTQQPYRDRPENGSFVNGNDDDDDEINGGEVI